MANRFRYRLGIVATLIAAALLLAACGNDDAATATSTSEPTARQTTAPNPSETAASNPSETTAPNPSETAASNPSETAAPSPSESTASNPSETRASNASETTAPDPMVFPEVVAPEEPLEAPSEVPEELKAIWEAWALLTRQHVDRSTLDPVEFTDQAIRGMLRALDDPHTNYVSPEAFQIENQDILGQFEGIGATVSMRPDGKLIIVSPLERSPAMAAGIRPGDVILEVDGESLVGLSLLEAVARIRGPRGSQVRLLVHHLGAIDPVEILVTRDVIPLVSVLLRSEPGDKIAHIRLTSFYPDTAEILAETIQEAVGAGAEALIVDVRDNPGGLLSSVVDVVSQFIGDGLVLYEVDGAGQRKNHTARKGGVAIDIPMVVLTNEFSASASEILVGALQDHNRATIIGASTFGKGNVNILRRLSNDGGLYITIARWFTPKGRAIERGGLEPDIEVVSRDRQKAETTQLEKAIEVLEAQLGAAGSGA